MEKTNETTSGVIYAPYALCEKDMSGEVRKICGMLHKLDDDGIADVYSHLMREIYYRTHKCCPQCGSRNITLTCVGYPVMMLGYTLKEKVESLILKDLNKATCSVCGWSGKFDDLE